MTCCRDPGSPHQEIKKRATKVARAIFLVLSSWTPVPCRPCTADGVTLASPNASDLGATKLRCEPILVLALANRAVRIGVGTLDSRLGSTLFPSRHHVARIFEVEEDQFASGRKMGLHA